MSQVLIFLTSTFTFPLTPFQSSDTNTSIATLIDLQSFFNFLFAFSNIIYYLFLSALVLHCLAQAFSSWSKWGLLFIGMCGLPIVVAEHTL